MSTNQGHRSSKETIVRLVLCNFCAPKPGYAISVCFSNTCGNGTFHDTSACCQVCAGKHGGACRNGSRAPSVLLLFCVYGAHGCLPVAADSSHGNNSAVLPEYLK